MNRVTIGSCWSGGERIEFTVRDVVVENGETWIHYGRHAQDTTYSCLIDAFLHRFKEILN